MKLVNKGKDGGDLDRQYQLVHSLIEHNLVDEYRLMIDPLILGAGKRIFQEDGTQQALELVESKPTKTGAVPATYAPTSG